MMSNNMEQEIIKFYLVPNSAREIERKYGINLYQLKKLLKKYNIKMHSKADAYKLHEERTKVVCLEKYGVTNPFAAEDVKNKIKETMLEKYGVEYVGQAELSKQKTKETLLDRYGVDHYSKTEKFKTTYTANASEYKLKEFNTKKKLCTCSTSKQEEKYYLFLTNKYGKDNVKRQFYDIRYPYHCDFYIKSEDLFIELNLNWTHGPHPFDESNQADIELLNTWKKKAEFSDYYKNAITTWTIRDVNKRKSAISNNIRYKVYYNEEDLYD